MAAATKSRAKILTLGDGDFTFSLDLARYLSKRNYDNYALVASGIDTKEELLAKYRDTPRILKELEHYQSPGLKVSVQHGMNAIIDDTTIADSQHGPGHFDHVIFNHPHLGTEDAALHGRFLSHFFYSCLQYWLQPESGFVYLTLVEGQYERWNCEKAATGQQLCLVRRQPFRPPQVDNPTFHYRRHQTGKSFESRRPSGSETLFFGVKSTQV